MPERTVFRSDRLPLAPLVPAPDPKAREYLQTYYRFRWLILLMGMGTAALGVGLSLFKTPIYRASATMAVTQSKLGEAATIGASSAAGFIPFVRNYDGAIEIIRKHKLDQPPHNLTPTKFLESSLTVTDIRN